MENEDKEINEEKELFRVKKKYSIKYVLTARMLDVYIVYMILMSVLIYTSKIGTAVGTTIFLVILIIFVLAFSKKSASQTYISFLETKVVYRRKFLFKNKEKTMNYSDIKDIVFTQGSNTFSRIFQKMFHIGNIYIYPKKGNILMNGISLEIVADIDKVIEDIKNTVGDRIIR